jgi:hypothetical protein
MNHPSEFGLEASLFVVLVIFAWISYMVWGRHNK